MIRLVYYLDVMSSWCYYAEPALARLHETFRDQLDYEWRIAWLADGGALNYTPAQLAWYYRRSGSISGTHLNAAWLRSPADGSRTPDLAVTAARQLGCTDDRVRLAVAKAGMIDGKHVGDRDVALAVAAAAGGLDPAALAAAMDDSAVESTLRRWSEEFKAMQATQRPTFVVTNDIGDRYMLSGNFRQEPLESCIRALLADADGYRAFESRGDPLPA